MKLRLLVVGDPELAAAAEELQGEWSLRTGSDFQVESITEEELADADVRAADAVICPSYQLGPLAERKLLTPVPGKLLPKARRENDHTHDDWSGIFELLKLREAVWGTKLYAVPFGSPALTCYYRADLLENLGRRPPQTWAEYQELAELLADRNNLGDDRPAAEASWYGTAEPLGPGWAGLVLLARAAPYAKHRDYYSTLFDVDTMEPLVARRPFVRALEELVAAAELGPPEQLLYDPAAVRAAFWQGRCGMALCWPTHAKGGLPGGAVEDVRVGFAELPGSKEVYDGRSPSPESRADDDDPHVPLLAVAGRIGVVSGKSAHPLPAFRLLFCLSGERWWHPDEAQSQQVCASSLSTTLFRQSHLDSPEAWVEKPVSPPAAVQYGDVTKTTFVRQQWLFAPRIPGRREYLAALDEAVRHAVRGEQAPAEALQNAAARWRELTERLGLEKQKAAYWRSLGLD